MVRNDYRSTIGYALALLALGTFLAACGGTEQDYENEDALADAKATKPKSPPTSAPSVSAPSVKVAFASGIPDGAFTPPTEAYIGSTAAVYVVADWTGVSTSQAERLVLVSPGGSTYYATEISLADATTSLVTSFALSDGTRRVVFKLLIWGTTIESYGEVGTWTAKATLVNGSAAAAATMQLL